MQVPYDPTSEINVRLESIKAAAAVASRHEGIANLLVHAEWVNAYIITGKSPAVGTLADGPLP